MVRPTTNRFDVWTDAGRERGDLFLIGNYLLSTPAFALARVLESQGWRVEMRPCQEQLQTLGLRLDL